MRCRQCDERKEEAFYVLLGRKHFVVEAVAFVVNYFV
jgi:hypothetical protein